MTLDLHAITDAVSNELGLFLAQVEADARQMLKDEGRDYEGDTAQSITSRVTSTIGARGQAGAYVTGEVGAGAPHAYIVHEGRQPGSMPPYEPIRRWVEKKLGIGPGEREARDVAFTTKAGQNVAFTARVNRQQQVARAIQRKIEREGTEGTPFLLEPFEARKEELLPRLEAAVARTVEGLEPPPIELTIASPFL